MLVIQKWRGDKTNDARDGSDRADCAVQREGNLESRHHRGWNRAVD